MNFCVTDGLSVLCTRYVSSLHDEAASLYFSSGTSFYEREKGHFRMRKEDRRQNIVVVASEPLTFEKADWMEVPTNTMIVITKKMNVLQIPILDEFSPLDRAAPVRAPRASIPTTGQQAPSTLKTGGSSKLQYASEVDPRSAHPLAHRLGNLSLDSIAVGPRDGSVDSASSRGTDRTAGERSLSPSSSNHRSPAFALHAGFPPNGQYLREVGGSR